MAIQLRRGTSTDFATYQSYLETGEPAIVTDTDDLYFKGTNVTRCLTSSAQTLDSTEQTQVRTNIGIGHGRLSSSRISVSVPNSTGTLGGTALTLSAGTYLIICYWECTSHSDSVANSYLATTGGTVLSNTARQNLYNGGGSTYTTYLTLTASTSIVPYFWHNAGSTVTLRYLLDYVKLA